MHETLDRSYTAPRASERSFGIVMAVAFALVAIAPLRHGLPVRPWLLFIAAVFAGAAAIRPTSLRPLNTVWMTLGLALNRVTSPLLLGAVFFLAVAPIGALMRVFGRRPLRLERDAAAATYWIERTAAVSVASSMRRQF